MEPLNLAICDDLPEEREKLLALLEQAPIATNCTQFGSSEELLEAFLPGKFDLLLMDIYMDGMTGVEAVQKSGRWTTPSPSPLPPPVPITLWKATASLC